MTYIIHPIIFYLIGLITKANAAFSFLMFGVFGLVVILVFIAALTNECYEGFKESLKDFKVKTFLTIGFITMFLGIFIPEPKTAYYMLAASVVTEENVKGVAENTTEIITELVEGISDALDNDNSKEKEEE